MFDSNLLTFLTIGFLLGLRHALDVDHLAAVSTVLAERPSKRASGLVGLCWRVGHTLTLMLVGAVVLVSGFQIPDPFALLAESGVGLLLVVLGGTLALKLFRERWHLHRHVHDGEPHMHLHSHRRHEDSCSSALGKAVAPASPDRDGSRCGRVSSLDVGDRIEHQRYRPGVAESRWNVRVTFHLAGQGRQT